MPRASILFRVLLAATAVAALLWWRHSQRAARHEPAKVGILVATSGPRAEFDRPTFAGAMAAIDLINADGGVGGARPIEPLIRDTKGDPAVAAAEAANLLREGAVAVIGGTSASVRRAISDVLAPRGVALVCPTSSEGLDDSPSLVTLGTLPNQRAVPASAWAARTLGRRLFLLSNEGSNQRVVHAILRDHVPAVGGTIAGEMFLPSDSTEADAAVAAVLSSKADVVISGLGRTSTAAFAKALRKERPGDDRPPTVLWQLRMGELDQLEPGQLVGDYLVASTFVEESGDDPAFLAAYAKHAEGLRADARTATGAAAARLIAVGIEHSGGVDPASVRAAMRGARVDSPGGVLAIDPRSQAAWKMARVGRIERGGVKEAWTSGDPIRPRLWPAWRTQSEWEGFLADPKHDRRATPPAPNPTPIPTPNPTPNPTPAKPDAQASEPPKAGQA